MNFLLENILNPFIIAFSSILGGIIPLGFLLFIYSQKEKNKLLKIVEYQKKHILKLEELKRQSQRQLDEFIEKIGDFNVILNKNIPDDYKKALADFLSSLRDDVFKFDLDIIKAQSFISYAEQYNFWTVIQDILKRNYIGEGFWGSKKD